MKSANILIAVVGLISSALLAQAFKGIVPTQVNRSRQNLACSQPQSFLTLLAVPTGHTIRCTCGGMTWARFQKSFLLVTYGKTWPLS